MGKINDDVYGSSLIRDGRIMTSDIQDGAVTTDKLADEVTESLLPAVTADDKDKVPVVNEDGEWELGTAGGGGGGGGGGNYFDVVLSIVPTESGGDSYFTCDRTYAELEAAIENNNVFRVWLNAEVATPPMGLQTAYSVIQEGAKFTFAIVAMDVVLGNNALTYRKTGVVVEVTENSVTGDFYPATEDTE